MNKRTVFAAVAVLASIATVVLVAGFSRATDRMKPGMSMALGTEAPTLALVTTDERSNPSSPRYDPTAFRGQVPLAAFFDQEPRVESWAKPVEEWLATRLSTDLSSTVPEVKELRVECRMTSCKFSWTGPASALRRVKVVQGNLYTGPQRGAAGPNALVVNYRAAFLRDIETPQELLAWFEQNRRRMLPKMKGDARFSSLIDPRAWPLQ